MKPHHRTARRVAGALAGLGLALGLTLGATGTARADVDPGAGWNEIYNPYLTAQHITLCADDTNGSTALDNGVQLYHCHGYDSGGAPQRWIFTPYADQANGQPVTQDGHVIYEIRNQASGWCTYGDYNHYGSQLLMEGCNFGGDLFLLIPAPGLNGADFQIKAADGFTAACVAASNFTDNNNTRLVMEPCSASDTRQLFRLG